MKRLFNYNFMLCLICFMHVACEDENGNFPRAASLKIVHAIPNAPKVHVDYFGMENLNFSVNPTLGFRLNERYTLPAGVMRDIRFTYEVDTSNVVFQQQMVLEEGQISTLFLLGDSANIFSTVINDIGMRTLRDSVNAIRFGNMVEDIGAINVGLEDSSILRASDLAFSNTSEFIEFDATLENPSYTFVFRNEIDSVLAEYKLNQNSKLVFPGFPPIVSIATLQKNLSLVLIESVNVDGNTIYQVVRVDGL